MKKIISLSLAAIMTAAALTACTSSSASATTAAPAPANQLERIRQKGVLTVATEPYFAPEEFIDPNKTGQEQYVGADIELAKVIAAKIGVELEIVPLEFTAVLSSVTEGKYDLAISALAYTPARAEAAELSKGYFFTKDEGYGLITKTAIADSIKGPEDIADRTIVTQSGSLQESLVNAEIPKYKEFKRVSSMDDAFLAVREGKADAAAVAIENAKLYVLNNPDADMAIVEPFRFNVPEEFDGLRVGAKKGETELIELVNECIDEVLADGQYQKWYEEYSAYAAELGI